MKIIYYLTLPIYLLLQILYTCTYFIGVEGSDMGGGGGGGGGTMVAKITSDILGYRINIFAIHVFL